MRYRAANQGRPRDKPAIEHLLGDKLHGFLHTANDPVLIAEMPRDD
jgi:hypothetical protein